MLPWMSSSAPSRWSSQAVRTAEPDWLGGTRRDRQFRVPIELLAVVEEHQIGQRLAQIAGRQKADILRQAFGEDPDPDLVLNAENSSAEQRVVAEPVIALARQCPFCCLKHQPRADEFLDLGLHLEQAANGAREPRRAFRL